MYIYVYIGYLLKEKRKNAYIYAIVHLLFLKHGTTFVLELTQFLDFFGLLIMGFLLSMRKKNY